MLLDVILEYETSYSPRGFIQHIVGLELGEHKHKVVVEVRILVECLQSLHTHTQ